MKSSKNTTSSLYLVEWIWSRDKQWSGTPHPTDCALFVYKKASRFPLTFPPLQFKFSNTLFCDARNASSRFILSVSRTIVLKSSPDRRLKSGNVPPALCKFSKQTLRSSAFSAISQQVNQEWVNCGVETVWETRGTISVNYGVLYNDSGKSKHLKRTVIFVMRSWDS